MADSKGRFPSAQDLRTLSEEELRTKLQEFRRDLLSSRIKHATANLEATSDLKALRRSIARMETILNEKESQRA